MNIIQILRYIIQHPFNKGIEFGAVKQFFTWQINNILNPYPIVYPLTSKSNIIAFKGLSGVTGNIYCGLHEFADMGFLLHFLRPGDLFVDVGANVGVYTILSSVEIGAKTISIEPIPSTFSLLKQNIMINAVQERVELYNIGVGKESGTLKFTKGLDTVNHVVSEQENNGEFLEVPVKTLDELCMGMSPALIKIDVEGFETEVLNGANEVLKNPGLKAIIIELNGTGSRYGYDERQIHDKLLLLGFLPHSYEPFTRVIEQLSSYGTLNTIYLRDTGYVTERVRTAGKVQVKTKAF